MRAATGCATAGGRDHQQESRTGPARRRCRKPQGCSRACCCCLLQPRGRAAGDAVELPRHAAAAHRAGNGAPGGRLPCRRPEARRRRRSSSRSRSSTWPPAGCGGLALAAAAWRAAECEGFAAPRAARPPVRMQPARAAGQHLWGAVPAPDRGRAAGDGGHGLYGAGGRQERGRGGSGVDVLRRARCGSGERVCSRAACTGAWPTETRAAPSTAAAVTGPSCAAAAPAGRAARQPAPAAAPRQHDAAAPQHR